MSRRVSLPKIDVRKAEHLLRQLRRMAPHYTREWAAKDDDDPGVALLKIFSSIAEDVINRLNRAPDRNFLAFLDMLGIRLLPKTPARAPVTFRLANGTEAPFLVPKETQVSAAPNAERPEELPFETIEQFLAIPAKLTELFVVDPGKDHIYKPQPKFLALEKVGTDLAPLQITAFSAKDSKFLQLDPPDQVKKDDLLRIDRATAGSSILSDCAPPTSAADSGAADHFVVLDAQGSIVTVTDPLPRDYVEGTAVKKVTDFELFEARNWQEHVLYLGHADYFAIKSEAQIELKMEQAGTPANLEPLSVVWEFFGVTETEKEDEWRRFEVDLDGTNGFSRNGNVVLNKPAGEIKEKEIDGRKNRWIRARLDGPLPATPARLMPTVESVLLKVSSAAEGLAPDQAFHNETPLTTDVEFFPFGTEPRTFDRFAIASEEAFSKHGAEISLDFEFDTADLLASPTGVVDNKKFRIFARTVGGKLLEFKVTPETSDLDVDQHNSPKDTSLVPQSVPAVVIDANRNIGAFAIAKDGKIYLRFVSPTDQNATKWYPLAATPGTLQFSPAAIFDETNWLVFAVADNRLYQQTRTPTFTEVGSWTAIPDPPEINSAPFVLRVGESFAVFVTDTKGKTWMFSSTWSELVPNAPDPDYEAAPNARPFAVAYTAGNTQQFRVYLRSKNDQLIALDTDKTESDKFETPQGMASDPTVMETTTGEKVYVRGNDNHLWCFDVSTKKWNDQQTATGINLAGNPFTIGLPVVKPLHVSTFSTSDKNALLEFRVNGAELASGKLQAGPHKIVFLLKAPSPAGTYHFRVLSGPGATSSGDAVRKLLPPSSNSEKFRELEKPLDDIPTEQTEYELLHEELSGKVKTDATDTTLTLETNDAKKVKAGDYLYVNDQLRRIPNEPTTDEVTIESAWATKPKKDDEYVLLRADHVANPVAKLAASSAARAVLDAGSIPADEDLYKGKFLQITSGPGASDVGRRIERYFKSTNNVLLLSAFTQAPTSDSSFRITPGAVPQAWFVHKDPQQSTLRPELSWEYWNGRGWLALKITEDTTDKLLVKGHISFVIPDDIEKTEVAGQENYWIRARIVGGDYGREQFKFNQQTGEVTSQKDPIRPPKVIKKGSSSGLTIKYKLTELKQPEFCLTFNNLSYLDQTAANNTADKHFKPYLPLEDTSKAVYFGFDREFSGGPVQLYIEAKELDVDDRDQLELTWEIATANTWKSMSATDKTKAFTRPGFVSWIVPLGLQNRQELGKALYWVRATLTRGDWRQSPLFKGIFLNTVAALQARTVRNEIIGSSTGTKNQKFRFQQVPVLPREEVRVLEALTDNQREQLKEQGDDVVRVITDQRGEVLQTWIKWTEVREFFDSKPESRHYRLDRHTGEIEFGDGAHGRIPPPGGDAIQAFAYQTGGGVAGNVQAGEITAAVTAVSGVDSVINPVGAGGGSEAATNEEMLEIGPAQISHRDRAVTPEDFERLAREASREVRKALCLPNRNAGGRHELGWTSVFIVPASKAATPTPTLALRRSVQDFLAERADVTLVHQDRIFVGPPKYVPVSVEVTVVAKSFDRVASAEQSVRQKLEQFLHPLTGGPANEGWDFGRDLAASDLYALLEDIDDVDHIATLRMVFGDSSSEDKVDVDDDALVASGTHKISMDVVTENR